MCLLDQKDQRFHIGGQVSSRFTFYTNTKLKVFTCESWIIKYSANQPIKKMHKTPQKT